MNPSSTLSIIVLLLLCHVLPNSKAQTEEVYQEYLQRMGLGNHTLCNLCTDGAFPTNPSAGASVSEHPEISSCRDIYYWGRLGHFPDPACHIKQLFYADSCGCVEVRPGYVFQSSGFRGGGVPSSSSSAGMSFRSKILSMVELLALVAIGFAAVC